MNNSQGISQLKLLGYQIGDRVPIFQSPPKGMSPEEMLKHDLAFRAKNERTGKTEVVPLNKHGVLVLTHDGAKFEKQIQSKNFATVETFTDGLAYLANLSQKGYSTYLYVNGARYNRDVKLCPALFYECDDCSKDEQWQKVENLKSQGFEPSFVVDSGKSLHVYFVVNGLTVEDFPKYQQRLIQLVNSDPSIHNLARQMRLAGFDHTKFVDGAIARKPINIALESGKTYDVEEFDKFLPAWEAERWDRHSSHDIDLEAWEKVKAERKAEFKKTGKSANLIDFLNFEVLPHFDHNPESLFNWTGHNFKAYGRTLKGQPPNRTSDSGTSFHVWHDGSHWAWQDKQTREGGGAIQYRYMLRGGIGTPKGKDFIDVVRELAADVGLELPIFEYEKVYSTPIAEVAKKLKTSDDSATKNRENVNRFVDLIKKTAENLTAKPRGFAAKIAPLIENISTNHDDVLMFKTGDRNRTYADLSKQGHRLIIDRSGTGKGKSHDAGLATTSFFNEVGVETNGTVFLSNDYLNPTTTTLEDNRTVVPPRHGGQVQTADVTPSGKKHLKRWDGTKNTNPDIVANCPEEHPINGAFTIARRKGIPIEAMLTTTTDEIGNPKTVNKICARCPLLHTCEFKSDRRDALVHSDLMMHPQSQPNDPSFYEGKIAIVDEADKTLIPVEKVSATKAQILETAHWLKEKFPDISVIVDPILHAIATALDNLNGENYHGIEKSKLLPMLGILPDADTAIAMADEIIGLMLPDNFEESDRVNLDGILELPKKPSKQIYTNEIKQQIKLLNSPKSIFENEAQYQARFEVERDRINKKVMHQYDQDIAKWEDDCIAKKKSAKATQKAANSTLGWDGKSKMMGVIENAPFNVVAPMLRAIATNGAFYLSRDNDGPKFNIALPNIRQQEQMTSYHATIFQSATMTPNELRARLGLSDDYPIIEIAQEGTFDIIPNLKVVQVTGIGNTLRRLSEPQKIKLDALESYAFEKHGDTAKIGYKSLKDLFYFGKHDRGTNQFSGMPSMIAAGIPLQNLGDKLAEYQVLIDPDASANSDGFMVWYYQQAIAQMTQTNGRQRAAQYPNDQFVFYVATDIPLPKILGGAEVTQVDIGDLCPAMASLTSDRKKAIWNLAKETVNKGVKVTQQFVADALGMTQQAVSKTYGAFIQIACEYASKGIELLPISDSDKAEINSAIEEIAETLDSDRTVAQKLKDVFDWTLYNIPDRLFPYLWRDLKAKYQAELLRLIAGTIPNWLTS